MTKDEWFKQANTSKDKLKNLIEVYHPANGPIKTDMRITAARTEQFCESVRSDIKAKYKGNPVQDLDVAIESQDTKKLYSLLSDAWFGVPESTSCWHITGFTEAVDLMDDPPDEDEEDLTD